MKFHILFIFILLIVCVTLLCRGVFLSYYIPHGSIILCNHFDYGILAKENLSKIYLIKTPLIEEHMRYCGEYFSHWAIMIKTDKNNYFVYSSSQTGNMYVYYIRPNQFEKVGDKYVVRKHDRLKTCWIIRKVYEPKSKDIPIYKMLNFMVDYVANMKYKLFGDNCHHVVSNAIKRFSVDTTPQLYTGTTLCKRALKEYLKRETVM